MEEAVAREQQQIEMTRMNLLKRMKDEKEMRAREKTKGVVKKRKSNDVLTRY